MIKIDVVKRIDANPISRFQWWIYILCGVCMVLDGFDVQAMGYVAPALLQDWQVDKAALGPVFGAGLFGLLIGSLLLSIAADKLGRRPVLLASTFFFGLCMLATPLARSIEELFIMRFITGFGLGAIMPNAMALCGEFSPRRKRISIMMLVSCGFTIGAMLGGVVAAALIPQFGWQSVFYLGVILPILLGLLMLVHLPESIQFQVLSGKKQSQALAVLQQALPNEKRPHTAQLIVAEEPAKGMPVMALFKEGRARSTLMIWCISFLNMIALYFLSNWLHTITKLAGLSLQQAVLVGAALQLGGTFGTVAMGRLIDRIGFRRVLIPCFISAAIFIALIGHTADTVLLLFGAVFLTGFAVVGGQPAINAMAANNYPTALRTTSVGWSLGIGRIGSLIGPVLGGQLIALNWSQSTLFHLVALPSVLIVLILLLGSRAQAVRNQRAAAQRS
ncbi:aromatic acid/H+ symport family MFS transporter [Aquitalea sp. LB_tupeE]|nr:aromatic acid/H+ symport family MFS transporter [Aquitalea sp. LB_tupeE]